MLIEGETLDDLLLSTYKKLLSLDFENEATRGKFSELTGTMLILRNPLARLSHSDVKGKTFSALGEFLWYFSGSRKLSFIKHYIPHYEEESYNGRDIYGAYGPRFLRWRRKYNQIENVIKLLNSKPTSRRAVIQLFDARDIAPKLKANRLSIPCTCTLQFICRNNKLEMITYMRSNDAYKGLPHDIYAFTMIQEIIASELGLQLGFYKHCVGSLHLYEESRNAATQYIAEGYQSTKIFMPPMPRGSQKKCLASMIGLEKKIRLGKNYRIETIVSEPYWRDIAYLLEFYSFFKKGDLENMERVNHKINTPVYKADLIKKIVSLNAKKNKND